MVQRQSNMCSTVSVNDLCGDGLCGVRFWKKTAKWPFCRWNVYVCMRSETKEINSKKTAATAECGVLDWIAKHRQGENEK